MKRVRRKDVAELEQELRFLERVAKRCSDDSQILKPLGDLYTRTGRYEDGLKVDLQLIVLCPNEPLVWYNLACSYALLERKNEAFESLARAAHLGYRDYIWMSKDADLRSLRDDTRFADLLKTMKR